MAGAAGIALASILAVEDRVVPLAKGKVTEGTTWSDGWVAGERGLASPKMGAGEVSDAWVEGAPVPAGLAWRPPRSVRVELFVEGELEAGAAGLVEAYVRHGCDLVNWSTWQKLSGPHEGSWLKAAGPPAAPGGLPVLARFTGEVGVPAVATREWDERRDTWLKSDPAWSSDDDEYARWLAAKDPRFFSRNLPFVGWTQFRVELTSLSGAVRLAVLHARLTWVVGGAAAIPKRGKPKSEGSPSAMDRQVWPWSSLRRTPMPGRSGQPPWFWM